MAKTMVLEATDNKTQGASLAVKIAERIAAGTQLPEDLDLMRSNPGLQDAVLAAVMGGPKRAQVTQDTRTPEQKRIAQLEAENKALRSAQSTGSGAGKLTIRASVGGKVDPKTGSVSKGGGISVYGLGQWPVTLYSSQWERLLAISDQIKAFIAEHPELPRERAK